jgi:beta-lactam-binding protein with PASTA domain
LIGLVLRQDPAPGTQVKPGATVTVVIGIPRPEEEPPGE